VTNGAARWERALRDADIAHLFLKGIGFDIWLGRDKRVSRDIDLLCPRPMRRAAFPSTSTRR
jgi:hypothetical protein